MKISIINHDSTASIKIDQFDSNGSMTQPEHTVMLMANEGQAPKEVEVLQGRVLLLTPQPDMTLESNGRIINPDSQQNIVSSERIDTVNREAIPVPANPIPAALRDIDDNPVNAPEAVAETPKMRIPTKEELEDKTVTNPDSQQNMTSKERKDVPSVAQSKTDVLPPATLPDATKK